MAYGDFKDLPRRAASDKYLRDKSFSITENPKHNIYQQGLASLVKSLLLRVHNQRPYSDSNN